MRRRRVDGILQRLHEAFHLLPDARYAAIAGFGQAPQLTYQMRPTAQAIQPGPVDSVTLADLDAVIAILQDILQHFRGAAGQSRSGPSRVYQGPQSEQQAVLRPGGLIHIQLRFLQEVGHQYVLQRKTGAPGFPEGLVDHADTSRSLTPQCHNMVFSGQLEV